MEYNSREPQHIMRDYNEFMVVKKMYKIEMSVEVLSESCSLHETQFENR